MTTRELLRQRLELVYRWYQGMINLQTGMLEYLYLPQDDAFVRDNSPIRDIGSVWDVELLSEFLNRFDLRPLIEESLRHYGIYLLERDGALFLDSRRLRESSSIAHSAFMILALLHAPPPRKTGQIETLAEGILRQQRPNGSYQVYFDELSDEGEELYAGEAMLALLETYRQLPDPRYRNSAERAASYYDRQLFQGGRVAEEMLVFFANWQSQAGRLLFNEARSAALKRDVAAYLFRMHDRIIERGLYQDTQRYPERQMSVEVACALEGLSDAYAIAVALQDERADCYRRCICTALGYLLELQCTHGGTVRERGGFGLHVRDRRQRIDITGHAAGGFMKAVENGIKCASLPGTGDNSAIVLLEQTVRK